MYVALTQVRSIQLPTLYQQDEEAVKKLTVSAGTKSKLPKAVQDLIKMIFDVESMKKAMVEFEVIIHLLLNYLVLLV